MKLSAQSHMLRDRRVQILPQVIRKTEKWTRQPLSCILNDDQAFLSRQVGKGIQDSEISKKNDKRKSNRVIHLGTLGNSVFIQGLLT